MIWLGIIGHATAKDRGPALERIGQEVELLGGDVGIVVAAGTVLGREVQSLARVQEWDFRAITQNGDDLPVDPEPVLFVLRQYRQMAELVGEADRLLVFKDGKRRRKITYAIKTAKRLCCPVVEVNARELRTAKCGK